jgi:hypothetical protein
MFVSLFILFALFAASRAFARYNDGSLSLRGLVFWLFIWGTATIFVLQPGLSFELAFKLGIGRGTDAVVYISVLVMFYMLFRIYIKVASVDQEITRLVRAIALKETPDK